VKNDLVVPAVCHYDYRWSINNTRLEKSFVKWVIFSRRKLSVPAIDLSSISTLGRHVLLEWWCNNISTSCD